MITIFLKDTALRAPTTSVEVRWCPPGWGGRGRMKDEAGHSNPVGGCANRPDIWPLTLHGERPLGVIRVEQVQPLLSTLSSHMYMRLLFKEFPLVFALIKF